LIPYVHLDTQWRWTIFTTINDYLPTTVRKNLALIESYPEYSINFTGAYRYALIEEYYPQLFIELKHAVTEHRWHPSGSMWEETDVLIPSAESIIRNILYGKNYFQQTFGRQTDDVMLPDSFGFTEDLPTLLSHCRISGFSTQKMTWDPVNPIPFTLGLWNGPDGSSLPALLRPGSYISRLLLPPHCIPSWRFRLRKHKKEYHVPKDAHYYGTGDTGQAPSTLSVKHAEISLQRHGDLVKQGASDMIFKELTASELASLPRYAGELMLRKHSAGTLSSQHIMKRWNKKGEIYALMAESAAVTASQQVHMPYPKEKIGKTWKLLIANQMHDVLPGTCSPDAYKESYNDEVVMLNSWKGIIDDSMQAIARQLPLRKGEESLLLYNPYAFERDETVDAVIPLLSTERLIITAPDGSEIVSQLVERKDDKAHIIFSAHIPSVGWSSYRLRKHLADTDETPDKQDCHLLENDVLRVTIDQKGNIASIFDKRIKTELLKEPIRYEFLHERPHTFPAWNMDWKDRKKCPYDHLESAKNIFTKASGPLQTTIVIEREHKGSRFVHRITLNKTVMKDLIICRDSIHWQESGCSLKVAIPLSFSNTSVTYGMDTSQVVRSKNTSNHYEYLSKGWIDQEKEDGSFGVAFIHGDVYGSDRPDDHTIRPTLLFTPGRSYKTFMFLDQMTQDWGRHTITYGIYPHTGSWRTADVDAYMKSLTAPIIPYLIKRRRRALRNHLTHPSTSSLFSLSSRQVGLLAVKQAEKDRRRIIIRLRELYGKDVFHVLLSCSTCIKEAYEVDGGETPMRPVTITGNSLSFSMHQNSIKAFSLLLEETNVAISIDSAQMTHHRMYTQEEYSPSLWGNTEKDELIPLQTESSKNVPIDLVGNIRSFTPDADPYQTGDTTYPLEQIPSLLVINDVPLRLMKEDSFHALACGGEQIPIPAVQEGLRPQYISCIMASDSDLSCDLTILDSDNHAHRMTLTVPSFTGSLGQYDTRIWSHPSHRKRDYLWWNTCKDINPGFIKKERLAWYTTHMHEGGVNLPHQYGYMFFYQRELPKNARFLVLPEDIRIKLFALTFSSLAVEASSSTYHTDIFDL